MLKLFCIPGRLLAKLFSREKKRAYRSVRSQPSYGPGIVLVSLVCWLALAGGILFAVDKAGLLKQALDVGVEVAQGGGGEETVPQPDNPVVVPPPAAPVTSGSATGDLSAVGQSTNLPSTITGGESLAGGANTPVIEVEQWLVILHSIPKSSRDEAERRRAEYRNKGLEVDILDTDAFHRLRKGNWIIALGPFEDRAEAFAAADRAKQFNSGLMVRRGL